MYSYNDYFAETKISTFLTLADSNVLFSFLKYLKRKEYKFSHFALIT